MPRDVSCLFSFLLLLNECGSCPFEKSLIRCIFSKFKVKNLFSAEDHGRISNGRNLGLLFGKNFRVLASIFAKGLANYVKQQRSIIGTSWTYSVLPTHM